MEIILTIATILGGITSIWFIWDKLLKKWIIEKPSRQIIKSKSKLAVEIQD